MAEESNIYSRVAVLAILSNGQVVPYAEAQNAHAGSMYICRTLSHKYGCPFDAFGVYRAQAIGNLFGSHRISRRDSIVLGFTFDRVWVHRKNIDELADALETFYHENSTYLTLSGKELVVPATLLEIAVILRRAKADESLRGVCFHQTSVAWNVWWLRDSERGVPVFFNFEDNQTTLDGGQPWELFEELEAKQAVSD